MGKGIPSLYRSCNLAVYLAERSPGHGVLAKTSRVDPEGAATELPLLVLDGLQVGKVGLDRRVGHLIHARNCNPLPYARCSGLAMRNCAALEAEHSCDGIEVCVSVSNRGDTSARWRMKPFRALWRTSSKCQYGSFASGLPAWSHGNVPFINAESALKSIHRAMTMETCQREGSRSRKPGFKKQFDDTSKSRILL